MRQENEGTRDSAAVDELASLKRALHAAQDEARGLRTECGALRGLVMAASGGGGGMGGGSTDEGRADELHEARRETELLKQENGRLARMLAEASSAHGQVVHAPMTRGFSDSRLHSIVAEPGREKAIFAACGYDIDTRAYVAPDVGALREAVASGGINLNCRDGLGNPPLAHAAWLGAEALIAELVMHGADLDAENLDGATPLHFCIFANQPSAAALLIAAGADPRTADEDAGAMGKEDVRAIFRAACDGVEHPALAKARAKMERVRAAFESEP